MSEEPSQADHIIGFWPGETMVEKRKALAADLGHPDDEKVRYWQMKKREIPQREHQQILDTAHRRGIRIKPTDFVRHLKVPSKAPAASAAG